MSVWTSDSPPSLLVVGRPLQEHRVATLGGRPVDVGHEDGAIPHRHRHVPIDPDTERLARLPLHAPVLLSPLRSCPGTASAPCPLIRALEPLKDRAEAQPWSVATGDDHALSQEEWDVIETYRMRRDGDQETVLARYRHHRAQLALAASGAAHPAGPALACWCRHDGDRRPGASVCHADVLIELLEHHSDEELRAMANRLETNRTLRASTYWVSCVPVLYLSPERG